MREIKFRAWVNGKMRCDITSIRWDDDEFYVTVGTQKDSTTVNRADEYLMQYTGLKDRNGTEIYEGDIVRYGISVTPGQSARKSPGIVVWQDEGAYFRIKFPESETGLAFSSYVDELWCEVIGNIHENGDLLK
jgi:uncharacterized phage protein (TIGR01671 family)